MTGANHENKSRTTLLLVLAILLCLVLETVDDNTMHLMNRHTSAQLLTSTYVKNVSGNTASCRGNGFSITYPSNWTQFVNCTFFSPSRGEVFPDPGGAYVRITPAYNLSMPISSIYDLARNVIFFANNVVFHQINPPYYPLNLKVGNAVELDYEWNRSTSMIGPPQVALPFVNQFSA